jgi:hypothetical protein
MRGLFLAFAAGAALGWWARVAFEPRATGDVERTSVASWAEASSPSAEIRTSSHPDAGAPPSASRAMRPRAPASELPAHAADAAPFSPEAVALLAEIAADADDPDANGPGVSNMAHRFLEFERRPNVPASLVRKLMARGGAFDQAGGVLFGCLGYDEAVREYRGLLAGAATAAAWGDAEHQREMALGFFRHYPKFAARLTDEDLTATTSARDPRLRGVGLRAAADAGVYSWETCLARARTDPDAYVRTEALDAAASVAGDDAATSAVADEILSFARSNESAVRAVGLERLGRTGAKGATLAREILDQGGADGDLYGRAVSCLVAARRFEGLASTPVDDGCRAQLIRQLGSGLEDDASIRPQVLDTLRALGMPRTGDELGALADVAKAADAMDLVAAAAKDASAPIDVRKSAFVRLVDDETTRAAGIALLGDVLRDPATSPAHRRALIEEARTELVRAGDDGVALLRRVAKDDANPRIRELAAAALRDFGK